MLQSRGTVSRYAQTSVGVRKRYVKLLYDVYAPKLQPGFGRDVTQSSLDLQLPPCSAHDGDPTMRQPNWPIPAPTRRGGCPATRAGFPIARLAAYDI